MNSSANIIIIRDLELNVFVGVFPHEKKKKQRLLINADVFLSSDLRWQRDDINETVSYDDLAERIKNVFAEGHIDLLETAAEKINESFFQIKKIIATEIKIEKPKIFKNIRSAGVIIKRSRV